MSPNADADGSNANANADTDTNATNNTPTEVTDMPEWRQQITVRESDRKLYEHIAEVAPEPVGTREAATAAGLTRQTAYNRLQALRDVGAPIGTKTIGDSETGGSTALARVWWLTDDEDAEGEAEGEGDTDH